MAKAMDKKSVIYGESKSQPAAGWSRWTEAQAAVAEKLGDKATVNWNAAKEALKKAHDNPKMKEAYIKIGLVGSDLVFRVKEKKFLGDIEEDAVLVRGYADKAAAHEQAQSDAKGKADTDRQTILDELKSAKDRKTIWPLLRKLGASQAELDKLDDGDAVAALLKKVGIDHHALSVSTNYLFTDKGKALGLLHVTKKPEDLVKLLAMIGVGHDAIDALGSGYSPEQFAKDLEAKGVLKSTALEVAERLVDAAPPSAAKEPPAPPDIAAAKDQASAIKAMAKRGVPASTLKGWTEQADLDDVVKAIQAKGVGKKDAERLAGLICP